MREEIFFAASNNKQVEGYRPTPAAAIFRFRYSFQVFPGAVTGGAGFWFHFVSGKMCRGDPWIVHTTRPGLRDTNFELVQ